MLAAAILAAGESSRMGQPKALLPYQGVTFVEHLMEATKHARIGARKIILGAGAAEIRAKLHMDPEAILLNEDWRRGPLTSIQTAIRHFTTVATDGLLVCPVDHPLISQHLISLLIEKFDASGKSIIIPTYGGRRGHPVIFRANLYQELLEASVEVGARQVVWAHAEDVAHVPTEEEGVVLNLNKPDTLRQAFGTAEES